MSLRFFGKMSGVMLAGVLFAGAAVTTTGHAVPVAGPTSPQPVFGRFQVNPPAASFRPAPVQVAACTPKGRTCKTSNECCSGTCADRGSKGMLCV